MKHKTCSQCRERGHDFRTCPSIIRRPLPRLVQPPRHRNIVPDEVSVDTLAATYTESETKEIERRIRRSAAVVAMALL